MRRRRYPVWLCPVVPRSGRSGEENGGTRPRSVVGFVARCVVGVAVLVLGMAVPAAGATPFAGSKPPRHRASTTTSVTSSLNPSSTGQSVTFTANVSPLSSPRPTGTVQFRDNANNLGSPRVLDASAQTTLSTAALTQGQHSITAVYGGDAAYSPSTSPPLTQNVSVSISTAVVIPSNGATVSGTTTLNANASPTGSITKVDLMISGGPLSFTNRVIGTATKS